MFQVSCWLSSLQVKPYQDIVVDNVQPKWSKEDTAVLREILKKFEFVRVEAILNSIPSNDYRDFVKARHLLSP